MIDTLQPTLVRASAGTGKTYRLTARLMKILLQGSPPESILATTFTRKAAGEILDRILGDLAAAADPTNPAAADGLSKLRDQVGIPTLDDRTCRQLLRHLVDQVHRLRIGTLDAFFSQLARSSPYELDLPPGWRLTDEFEETRLRQTAVETMIATLDTVETTTLLAMLSKDDAKRSIALELRSVVDSGHAISRSCESEVWLGIEPPEMPQSSEITRSAGRLRSIDGPGKRHQTKAKQIADALDSRDFKWLSSDKTVQGQIEARIDGTTFLFYKKPFPDDLEPVWATCHAIVAHQVLSLLAAQNQATASILSGYRNVVTAIRRQTRGFAFDDIAYRLADSLQSTDQTDGPIDHLLLDEFQDTSPVQWQVLRGIARRTATSMDASEDGEIAVPRSFFCVGDAKQAIYGWRGGVAEIFDAVSDQVPGLRQVSQDTSFRSSPVIIDVINDVFTHLRRHPQLGGDAGNSPLDKSGSECAAVADFVETFPTHSTARRHLSGYFTLETSHPPDERPDAEARRLANFDAAADRIEQLNRAAPNVSIGVLTRTNPAVGELIDRLRTRSVEVSAEGGNPLDDSPAVDAILSTLMNADHPGDGRWALHRRATPLADDARFGPDAVRAEIERHGYAPCLARMVDKLIPVCDARDAERLRQLVQLAIEIDLNRPARIRDFVDTVRRKRIDRPTAAPVRVMTVHQSKGLEFDAVFLPELDKVLYQDVGQVIADVPVVGEPPAGLTRYVPQSHWPLLSDRWRRAISRQVIRQTTEALCLLYVAMTRARQALHVIIPPAGKATFESKTSASLVYHALGCGEDPTEPDRLLHERGRSDWFVKGPNP